MVEKEDKTKRLRVGVIGLGRIAWEMDDDPLRAKPCTHVGAYLKSGCEIVAACDIDSEQWQKFSQRYGVKPLYEDFNEMLAEQRLDVLSICAYATERHAMVMAAIENNVPAIFCEKAFATSLEEADEMVAAIEQSGTRLVVAHMRRWVPAYHQVKALIDSGSLGNIQTVDVKFSGSLLHTGTHAFDVLQWWLGAPLSARGFIEKGAGPDEQSGYRFSDQGLADAGGYGQIVFANNVVANIEGRVKKYFVFEFDVVGSEGRVRIGNDGVVYFEAQKSTHVTGFLELAQAPLPDLDKSLPIGTAWETAMASVLSPEKPNPSTAVDARQALEMALAFYVSDNEGGGEIKFPLQRRGLRVPSR